MFHEEDGDYQFLPFKVWFRKCLSLSSAHEPPTTYTHSYFDCDLENDRF